MCSWKRTSYVLAAGCLFAAFASTADESSIERQKRLVVESALGAIDESAETAAIVEAARTAHAIEQVEYDSATNTLSIHVVGTPAVHWIFIKDTNRLAIDLYNAVNLVAGKTIDVAAGAPVESVRTSLFKLEPEIVSRVVLQLSGPVPVNLDDSEPGVLRFSFDGESTMDTPSSAPVPEPVADGSVDALVASIEAELDGQLARPVADRERLVTVFAETRASIAERHEALKADAELKAYPAQLGYLVLLADHEALLGGHLGEITGEARLIEERVETIRTELATILKSDFEEQALRDELNSILETSREDSAMDASRFEQILTIAADEQQVATGAIENLALKIAEAPSITNDVVDDVPMMVANVEPVVEDVEPEMVGDTVLEAAAPEAVFEVTDAEVEDESLGRIDELMELALADETVQEMDPVAALENEIIAGETDIQSAIAEDADDALAALDELASEMSRLRSHPSASDSASAMNSMQLLAMNLPPQATFQPTNSDATTETLEQVDLAPVELGAGQTGPVTDAASQERETAEGETAQDSLGDAKSLLDSTKDDRSIETQQDPAAQQGDVEIRPNTDADATNLPPVTVEAPDAPDTLAVGGPEVGTPTVDAPQSAQTVSESEPDSTVDAEISDSSTFESPVAGAEARPVPVENAESTEADPGVVAARASQSADAGDAPQVMAQATPGQPQVINAESLDAPMGPPDYVGDPMDQPVTIEFRDELLRNIIGLLAQKAGVNVIGGGTLGDITVSANMRDVPLRQAMNMLLRLEDFGMVEEEGVFRIVPYEIAMQLRRVTRMVPLRNAQADEVERTLTAVTTGATVDQQVLVASNKTANVVVLSGPLDRVDELEQLVFNLDIAEPTLPTITEAIRLNYAEPEQVKTIVETILTNDGENQIGKVEADVRGRSIVVTDLPVVVEQVRALIHDIDYPVQQVSIDSMVVDVTLTDDTATGVDWFVNLLRRTNTNGELVGNLSALQAASDFGGGGALPGILQNPLSPSGAGVLSFGILSSDFDIQGIISAEVNNNNAEILANPHLVTLENQPADIEIIQEFPYRELTQTEGGGQIASTEFKNIGTTLEVTPRVTADEDILVNIFVEQSVIVGFSDGDNVPITNNRRATTSVRTDDEQTIFIGGLRRMDDQLDVRKVPVLGDLPVISPLFRTTTSSKQNTDLLIFVTCRVLGERAPDLTGAHQKEFDRLGAKPDVPDSQREVLRTWAKPNEMRDPIWKWRRSK